MEPRMLDKINDLNSLRVQRERCAEAIKEATNDVLAEIKEIAEKANIPGYMLVGLGNSLNTSF